MCPFTYQKHSFIPRIALFLHNCYFTFENCPIVFQNCLLVFQKCLLFILFYLFGVRLFSRMFFSSDCTFSSSCWELLIENIYFVLVLFSLGTLYWPNFGAFLITLKPFHGTCRGGVSEHLEWLKISFTPSPLPHPQRGAYGTPEPQAVSHTAYSSAKIRCP